MSDISRCRLRFVSLPSSTESATIAWFFQRLQGELLFAVCAMLVGLLQRRAPSCRHGWAACHEGVAGRQASKAVQAPAHNAAGLSG